MIYTILSQLPKREAERWDNAQIIDGFPQRNIQYDFSVTKGVASATLEQFLEEVTERLTRWHNGNFYINEAAQILADCNPELDASSFCEQMEAACKAGHLIIRKNGIPIDPDEIDGQRQFSKMVRRNDVNDWLRSSCAGFELAEMDQRVEPMSENYRVTVDKLAWEIAQCQTEVGPNAWKEGDGDDEMRRTVVSAMNKYGWTSQDGGPKSIRPGTLPHILKLLEEGVIQARSTFNNMPPVDTAHVVASPASWYVTQDDAEKVRVALIGTPFTVQSNASLPVATPKKPASGPKWTLRNPKRFQGYGQPLYELLKVAYATGLPRPTARYVLTEFSKSKHPSILCVSSDSLDYLNGNGDKVTADIDAIRVAIGRLILNSERIADDSDG